jgi:hypothetical protein
MADSLLDLPVETCVVLGFGKLEYQAFHETHNEDDGVIK